MLPEITCSSPARVGLAGSRRGADMLHRVCSCRDRVVSTRRILHYEFIQDAQSWGSCVFELDVGLSVFLVLVL
jgi:hypothetical protein